MIDHNDNGDDDNYIESAAAAATGGNSKGGQRSFKRRSFAGYDCVALGLPNASFAPASTRVTMAQFRSSPSPSPPSTTAATTLPSSSSVASVKQLQQRHDHDNGWESAYD
jgi:hypothetical protein